MSTGHGQGAGSVQVGYIASAAITKYRCVEQVTDDNTCQQIATAGHKALGVAQEGPTSTDATNGRIIDIQIQGVTLVEYGGTVTRGDRVVVDNTGRVVTATTGNNQSQVGIALESGVVGDWHTLLLTPGVMISV